MQNARDADADRAKDAKRKPFPLSRPLSVLLSPVILRNNTQPSAKFLSLDFSETTRARARSLAIFADDDDERRRYISPRAAQQFAKTEIERTTVSRLDERMGPRAHAVRAKEKKMLIHKGLLTRRERRGTRRYMFKVEEDSKSLVLRFSRNIAGRRRRDECAIGERARTGEQKMTPH